MPGFDKSRIVGESDEDLDEFTCGICFEIFINPVVTHCCRQTYCSECIHQWLKQDNNSCPNDRKLLTTNDLSPPPRLLNNLLSNMRVKCDFHMKGCETVVQMRELVQHLLYCDYNPMRKCKTCQLICDSNSEHNCIENLIIENKTFKNEIKSLRKENSELFYSNEKDRKLIEELSMQSVIESARNHINDYVIERGSEKMSDKLMKYFIIECKRAVLNRDTYNDMCKTLFYTINKNKSNERQGWSCVVYAKTGGDSLIYDSLTEDYFGISFDNLIIELILMRK